MSKKDDAWKQYFDLIDKYTQITEVRSDIKVTAVAWDRGVEVRIARENPGVRDAYDINRWLWQSTGKRNVSTMRELAQAIIDACDFVEASNPKWASR